MHDGFVASEKKNFEIRLLFLNNTLQCRTLALVPVSLLSSFRLRGGLVGSLETSNVGAESLPLGMVLLNLIEVASE
jgi:hypothetical protein